MAKDCGDLARLFLKARMVQGGFRTLHWFQGEFWQWTGRIYQRVESPGLIEDQLIHWLATLGDEYKGERVASWTFRNLQAVLRREQPPRQPTWLHPDDFSEFMHQWLQLKNGILDLDLYARGEKVVLRPPDPRFFSGIEVPVEFDKDALCPLWETCILDWMEGDLERVSFLQEYVGWCLVPGVGKERRELALLLEGEGSNGKSTFIKIVQAILGKDNYSAVPVEQWKDQFALYTMHDKLVNFCSETDSGRAFPSHILKGMISADRITCRTLYKAPITVEPTARLIVSWNRRPKVTDNSDGFWRKIKLVPWRQRYPGDTTLEDRLIRELPGIFNWACQGLGRLWAQGKFTRSRVIEEVSTNYRAENDPVKGFCGASLNLGGDVSKGLLYERFCEWLSDRGIEPIPMEKFCKEVLRAYPGVQTVRRRDREGARIAYYTGISLKEDEC